MTLKEHLTEGKMRGRHWWRRTKQEQGSNKEINIPPIKKDDGSYATLVSKKLKCFLNTLQEIEHEGGSKINEKAT